MDDYKELTKQIDDLKEKRRPLALQLAPMLVLPESYGAFSIALINDLQQQIARIDEQLIELEGRRGNSTPVPKIEKQPSKKKPKKG